MFLCLNFNNYFYIKEKQLVRSIMAKNNKKNVCLREFIHKAVALPDDEFEMAMRLENNDEDINNIKIIAQPLDSYDRN